METFEFERVNQFILKKHHLLEDSKINDLLKITEELCGLHSTEFTTSYLSLFARMNSFKKVELEKELYSNKTLARVRGMRRTLFIETLNLIPIVHSATYNLVQKSFEKYMQFHKVTIEEYEEISQKIIELLKGRELSASEIRKELNSKLNIPAIIHVMCNNGLLLRGRPIRDWKDRRNKYALFKDYFPELNLTKLSEIEAIQQIVEKYLHTYGPVSENDISWWTGLTKSKIRRALQNLKSQIEEVKISQIKVPFLITKKHLAQLNNLSFSEQNTINLLPKLDPYPMGYKERERYIDEENYSKVFDRSGNATSTIFLNGKVIGVWDTEDKTDPIIKFFLFQPIENDLMDKIYCEVEKVGNFFFDCDIQIKECKSMIPLTERNAGGFMSPLKDV